MNKRRPFLNDDSVKARKHRDECEAELYTAEREYLDAKKKVLLTTRRLAETRRAFSIASLAMISPGSPIKNKGYALSPRQQQVLSYVVAGERNKTIAEELHITIRTVKFHTACLFAIYGVTNRRELASMLNEAKQEKAVIPELRPEAIHVAQAS